VARVLPHCRLLTNEARVYIEAFAGFVELIKAAFPASQLVVSLGTDQRSAVEKAVLALDGLRVQLQGVSSASKDFRGREEVVSDACDHINACLERALMSALRETEDAANQKLASLSGQTTDSIGKVARPSTSDERAKVIKGRWDQVASVEKSRGDTYQHYRLLENTVACLRVTQQNLNMFIESRYS